MGAFLPWTPTVAPFSSKSEKFNSSNPVEQESFTDQNLKSSYRAIIRAYL